VKWTIAIIGTLDTKGEEFSFLKDEIEKRGCRTLLIDVGVLGQPMIEPDIPAEVVAEAGGARLSDLVEQHDRGRALDTMSIGIAKVMRQLNEEGRVDGVISMGGGGGTAIGTSGMRVLPVEVPKLMVSTIAAGDTSPYVGTTNITMMPSIVDVAGLNRISRRIFAHAAGAICGMVMGKYEEPSEQRPLIAASMFGNTTRAVGSARHHRGAVGQYPRDSPLCRGAKHYGRRASGIDKVVQARLNRKTYWRFRVRVSTDTIAMGWVHLRE
jgi:uncharacterized protein (UPF0261 family)